MSVTHLYVHIPFCRSRCAYCDFASEPVGPHARAGRVDEYLERLRVELAERAGVLAVPLETIYVGGGTPTVLPREALLELMRDLTSLQRGGAATATPAPDPEFTIEANPGTIDVALLQELAAAGVTRVSLGVQSFSPRLRKVLGRQVSQPELEEALATLTGAAAVGAAGLEWNLDLIHGIPDQTREEAAADLDRAVATGAPHISLYDLTYTPEYGRYAESALSSGAMETAAAFAEEHYARASARLEEAGYTRYEVSNFALPGHECRHNVAYWRGEDYLGVGAGAVSTVGLERRGNPRTVAAYLAGEASEVEVLNERTRLWEKAMLGLRTRFGVDEEEVGGMLDPTARERFLRQGCLERHCGKLRLNPGFLDLSNSIITALLVPLAGPEADPGGR